MADRDRLDADGTPSCGMKENLAVDTICDHDQILVRHNFRGFTGHKKVSFASVDSRQFAKESTPDCSLREFGVEAAGPVESNLPGPYPVMIDTATVP
ncbi:hypothetical protein [Edaphobacter dinghuensis]|uniref:hypothetical protein n=1 Tax=Edaphobacter dinghuensis TaxID=1560005 RepID=UPI00166B34CC|nr:hypothetical protein [Edaphobacter dinghuensis]